MVIQETAPTKNPREAKALLISYNHENVVFPYKFNINYNKVQLEPFL
jgi:hypothetical protein